MKKILTIIVLLCIGLTGLVAQQVQISGTVTGVDDGQPLPGVSVSVKGTTIGTVTNLDGKYSLQVPEEATVLFTFVGMVPQEIAVGNRRIIDVAMQESAQEIEEVVVTAMGISREKKSLGYSVQSVSSGEIARTSETNVINSLASKVAGLQVISSGGVPGASSKILIRGNSSFTGNNQPLIVLDGVPIDNSTRSTVAGDYPFNPILEGVNNSNRALDINPDDIESVTVLKGPSAAALYGARAANGAIIYTTKRGGLGVPKVVYGITTELNTVGRLPEEQTKYAQGTLANGYLPGRTVQSWGPAISSLDGVRTYDNTKDFFETGIAVTQNLAITGGNDKNMFRASIGRLDQNGIVPNSDFNRTSVRLNADSKITDAFTASASMSYTNSNSTKVQNGSNTSGIMLPLMRAPVSWNLSDWQNEDGSSNNYVSSYDNPYWTAYNNPFKDDINRFIGNLILQYDVMSWLKASYKVGADVYTDRRKQIFALNSNAYPDGKIEEHDVTSKQFYQDVIISANRTWMEKLSTSLDLGGNLTHNYLGELYGRGQQLLTPNFYSMSNAVDLYTDDHEETIRSSALFADLHLSWDRYIFVNFTGRNEWSSTFGRSKNNFFYPSVSGSFIFTEFIPQKNILSYGKLRAAWATGGNSPDPYTSKTLYVKPYYADGFTDGNSFPYLGLGGFAYNNIIGNANLKPEKSIETELGLDMSFFHNRLGFEFTWYNKKTQDILVNTPKAGSSGFRSITANSGSMRNRGIEILLNASPVKRSGFEWSVNVNFTRNKNEVLTLADGVDEIDLESAFTSIASLAIKGDAYGALYATAWERNNNGQLIIGSNGLPKVSVQRKNLGNPFPDWTAGLRNTFTYKGFTLSALLDIRQGGMLWCGTVARMNQLGRTAESADRERTFVVPGVKEDGTPNDIEVSAYNYFVNYKGDGPLSATENAVFEGSWIRLRDLSLSYRFDLKNSWFKFVEVSFLTRNLWLKTDYPGVDPETSLAGAGSNLNGFDYFNNPGTKSFSFGLKFGIL